MHFKKYGSIENALQSAVEKIYLEELADGVFVVQEKVHGANFSLWTDGQRCWCGKRTSLLGPDSHFYNAQEILGQYQEALRHMYTHLKAEDSEVRFIAIFGELFGGHYPHPDVPEVKGAKKVQQGVCYAPHNGFYAFDIQVNHGNFVDLDKASALFQKYGFFYARPLWVGSLKTCLTFDVDFQSHIPGWLGLPALENNWAEGVVIKPNHSRFFADGSRVILKHKSQLWQENKGKRKKAVVTTFEPSESYLNLFPEATAYLSENRFLNLLSHYGEAEFPPFDKALGLFVQDALADFIKDFSDFDKLEAQESKFFKKALNREAKPRMDIWISKHLPERAASPLDRLKKELLEQITPEQFQRLTQEHEAVSLRESGRLTGLWMRQILKNAPQKQMRLLSKPDRKSLNKYLTRQVEKRVKLFFMAMQD